MVDLRQLAKDKACVLCGSDHGVVLHHLQLPGNHGTGSKPPDFPYGVRLCHPCHVYFHGEGRADHKLMCVALANQMRVYLWEGTLEIDDRLGGKDRQRW